MSDISFFGSLRSPLVRQFSGGYKGRAKRAERALEGQPCDDLGSSPAGWPRKPAERARVPFRRRTLVPASSPLLGSSFGPSRARRLSSALRAERACYCSLIKIKDPKLTPRHARLATLRGSGAWALLRPLRGLPAREARPRSPLRGPYGREEPAEGGRHRAAHTAQLFCPS